MTLSTAIWSVFYWLTSKMGAAAVAVVGMVTFVWFAGPEIPWGSTYPLASSSLRLGIILVIIVIAFIVSLFLRRKRAKEDEALLAALRRQQDEELLAAKDDAARQKARLDAFRDAARKAARFAGKGSSLFNRAPKLPWYLLIGSDHAGKTAFVRNSGLNLPYQDEDERRNDDVPLGDFHVADRAVLVETDGLILEQNAPQATSTWLRMLDILRKLRGRQKISGVIVAISASELVGLTPESELELSSILRRRLDEATSRLRTKLPAYLIVTKLDLLVGFEEFFDGLGIEDRTAVLGLPLTGKDGFSTGIEGISARLSDLLLLRLQEEADEQRRRRMFEFPTQFAALSAVLEPVIASLTANHRFSTAPDMRSVFFTSAAQSSVSVDIIAPKVAETFAQRATNLTLRSDAGRRSSRPYFLTGLMRDVVLPEADRSNFSRGSALFSRAQGTLANLALCALAAILAIFWWFGFNEGRAYTARLNDGYERAKASLAAALPDGQRAGDFEPILVALDNLRALTYEAPDHATFGLYSTGNAKDAARETYNRALEGLMVPYVWRHIRDDIGSTSVPAADRFQELKLYLMLVGDRPVAPAAAASLSPSFTARWLPHELSGTAVSNVSAHLSELSAISVPPLLHDLPLIDHARALLTDYTLARLAYDQMRQTPAIAQLPVWRPVDHMSLSGPQALGRVSGDSFWDGIGGVYTRSGYFTSVMRASGQAADALAADLWVMGRPDTALDRERESQRIKSGLLDLYRVDYIRLWDGLISDLTMVESATAGEVAQSLAIITGKPSPVNEFFAAISAETNFESEGGLGALAGVANQAANARSSLTGRQSVDITTAVTTHFKDFREAVASAEGQPSKVDAMLAALDPLYRQINHVATGGDILELGATPQTTQAQLNEQIATLPLPVQPLFRRILSQASAVTTGSSRERLTQIWSTTVLPACTATTQGRYPFDPRSNNDTSIADFASMFGPKGLIAGFRNDYLRPYIDTTGKPWRWRAGQHTSLGLSDEVLSSFEIADNITTAYFGDSDEPSVNYTVEPVKLDSRARAFQFDVGGPTLVYNHGPPAPMALKWPPERVAADAILSVTPEITGERNLIRRQGPWALFRLFDAGRITRPDSTDAVPYSFAVGSRQVQLKITAPATRNPFARDILSDFRCPVL